MKKEETLTTPSVTGGGSHSPLSAQRRGRDEGKTAGEEKKGLSYCAAKVTRFLPMSMERGRRPMEEWKRSKRRPVPGKHGAASVRLRQRKVKKGPGVNVPKTFEERGAEFPEWKGGTA